MKSSTGIITGIVIILGAINLIGVASLIPLITKLNLRYLGGAIFLTLFIMFLHSLRLKFIINSQKYSLGIINAVKIHIASNTANLMTPIVKVGGIPLKVHYLSKTNVPSIMSCASVIGEIITETFSFYFTFVVILIFLSFTHNIPADYTYLGAMIFGIFALLFLVSLRVLLSPKRLELFIKKYVLRFTTLNANLASKQFNCSFNSFISNRPLFYGTLFLSFFCRALEFVRINFIFLALGFNVSLGLVLTVWLLEAFFSGIPWLPGGVGLVEVGSISALVVLNIPLAIATTVILLNRLVSHWTPLAVGGIVMSGMKRNGVQCEI